MEPTDQYWKSKRNLILFSGLLLLSVTVGLQIDTENEGISLLPISMRDINYFDDVIALLVTYFFFQFSLFWFAQNTEIQQKLQYRIDFYASATIAGFALLSYVMGIVLQFVEGSLIEFASVGVGAGLLTAMILLIMSYLRWITRRSQESMRSAEQELLGKLTSTRWKLVFNPASKRGSKTIVFEDQGTIGEGSNNNEHAWRVRGDMLEILNSDGRVFSRFSLDKAKGVFVHTNDEDTLSIRSQRIEPL